MRKVVIALNRPYHVGVLRYLPNRIVDEEKQIEITFTNEINISLEDGKVLKNFDILVDFIDLAKDEAGLEYLVKSGILKANEYVSQYQYGKNVQQFLINQHFPNVYQSKTSIMGRANLGTYGCDMHHRTVLKPSFSYGGHGHLVVPSHFVAPASYVRDKNVYDVVAGCVATATKEQKQDVEGSYAIFNFETMYPNQELNPVVATGEVDNVYVEFRVIFAVGSEPHYYMRADRKEVHFEGSGYYQCNQDEENFVYTDDLRATLRPISELKKDFPSISDDELKRLINSISCLASDTMMLIGSIDMFRTEMGVFGVFEYSQHYGIQFESTSYQQQKLVSNAFVELVNKRVA